MFLSWELIKGIRLQYSFTKWKRKRFFHVPYVVTFGMYLDLEKNTNVLNTENFRGKQKCVIFLLSNYLFAIRKILQ